MDGVAQSGDTDAVPPALRAMVAEIGTLSDRVTRRFFALLPRARAVGLEIA